MATNPCSTDASLEDIKAAQAELAELLESGAKDALAAINEKATEISAKLNEFKPEVEEDPNLQKEISKIPNSDPVTAAAIVTDIQRVFGPVVSDLKEILNEVSPGLGEAAEATQEGTGGISNILSQVSSFLTLDQAAICERCKNVEVKTLPDGTQRAVEKPAPPTVPQTTPVFEPVKEPQSYREKNQIAFAKLIWVESQNATLQTLLNVYKKRPKLPEISDLEFKKQSNRFWANYTFLYIAYGNSIEPTVTPAGGLEDWPWRETWLPLELARNPDYIGEPEIGEDILYNLHKRLYNENNTTDFSFVEATQIVYNKAPEEMKIGIGVGKPFFKEI